MQISNGLLLNRFTSTNYARAGGSSIILDGLVSVHDSKLYTSGQIWANSVLFPSDGSAISDYDYWLGNSSSVDAADPTIVSSGADSAYWSYANGDYHTGVLGATEKPAFLRKMHHVSKEYTIEIWMYWNGAAGFAQCLWDSGTTDQGGSDVSRGVYFVKMEQPKNQFCIKQDSGGGNSFALTSDANLDTGRVNMIAVSYKSGSPSFLYKNGGYDPVGGQNTVVATLSSPGSIDSAQRARVATRGDAAFATQNGTRVYLIRVYNKQLTKEELDRNWDSTKSRFNL